MHNGFVQGEASPLRFVGGTAGALAPFALFVAGIAWLGFSGAPDERGFWPVLLAALALGLILARDRTAYSESTIRGMSQPIVMVMVMAWLLAGVLGTLMSASGFIEALVWLAGQTGVSGRGFVAAAFLVCCAVSTSTGTSLGTVIICSPLLYPAGGLLGAHPAALIGAILGGAVFGDNISPISDTTIASAVTQEADIGGVVRSRLKYALIAAAFALVGYVILGGGEMSPEVASTASTPTAGAPGNTAASVGQTSGIPGSPRGLPMLLAPALVLGLLLARRHLIEGLMFGIVAAAALGLALGLLSPSQILSVDPGSFSAGGLIIEGMERGLGVSIITVLLMGLVGAIEATGILDRIVDYAKERASSRRAAEASIFTAVSAVVFLIMHSAVAILVVGKLARETGEAFDIHPYRRANILDITVCTFPFLLPFFIPAILAASTTAAGAEFGLERVSPAAAGLYNLHSWALLVVVIFAIVTGFGSQPKHRSSSSKAN